jgi:maltose alpha-D-glucosyltransferase / alpha-amylase
MINDLWYKNAVIYCLSVGTFMDANGDGIGDFMGLMRRLDYLQGLGVTAIWLMPFQVSPHRDDGYDIADYYGVDPRYGTIGDFVEFTHGAKQRGIRVLIDLVVNHTSIEHEWFKQACRDPQSKYRDWYVWSKKKPSNAKRGMVFPGVQKSTWTFNAAAKAWYFHRFYDFQPDLNTSNPEVQAEILKIMGFWIQLGVSGFRMDAVPFIIAAKGASVRKTKQQYDMLRQFREFLQWRQGDCIVLAEANVLPQTDMEYFGSAGDRMHMMFNFQVNLDAKPHEVTFSVGLRDRNAEQGKLLINLLSEDHSHTGADGKHRLVIEAYGYRWYRVGGLDYLLRRTEIETTDLN